MMFEKLAFIRKIIVFYKITFANLFGAELEKEIIIRTTLCLFSSSSTVKTLCKHFQSTE